jgi:hypothetical protein
MRKLILLCGALVGFALLTGSITQGSPTLSGPGTIRITSRDVMVCLVNRGAPTRGTGDVLLIRQLLFNKGIRKAPIGHTDLVCTYTGPRARQCNGTYTLPRGTIVVSGSLRFRDFFRLAVVGGTELYDNVRGSLTVTRYTRRPPRREILLFRLVV